MRWPGLLLLVVTAGCSMGPPRVAPRIPSLPDAQREARYQKALDRATDREQIYDVFRTRAFLAATLQTEAFRVQRAEREAAFRSETRAELETRLAKERAAAAEGWEWFVGVDVRNPEHQDLDRAGSTWRVAMITPAGTFLPSRIERVGRSTEAIRTLYPYLDTFWVAYRVVFPRQVEGVEVVPEGTGEVVLELAGVAGQAQLRVPLE
ncbi:MAG TPA: hypothetical protein VK013_01535 [Myxococcaceae bacterium]|nr:hypothetical protein [Myxococcaceae bacterium]